MTDKPSIARQWQEKFDDKPDAYRLPPNLNAAYFDALPRHFLWRHVYRRLVKPGDIVLEAGIGRGERLLTMAWHAKLAVGLDFIQRVLEQTREMAAVGERATGRRAALALLRGDLEHPGLAEGRFDLVYNEGVVEHWLDRHDRVAILRRMRDLARPGGTVCVAVPHGRHPWFESWEQTGYPGYFGPHVVPFFRYGMDELRAEMTEAGLTVTEAGGLGAWSSLNVWPKRRWLDWMSRLGARCIPLPRRLADRYGTLLYAIARRETGHGK